MIGALPPHAPRLGARAFVAPNATVVGDVELGEDASVWFGAVLRGDVERLTVGRGSNVQDNSVLHADPGAPLVIGNDVTVGHMVMLHGCHVGDRSLIGIGSVVMNHARIGANCLVGARALVTEGKTFPDGVLIIGSPARVIRELTAAEIEGLRASAARYVQRAAQYRTEFRSL